jgi:hypothetical protein
MKLCPGCNEEKPLGHFNSSSKAPDGNAARCRACVNRRRRAATRRARTKPRPPLTAQAGAKKGDIAAVRAAVARDSSTDATRLLGAALVWATETQASRYGDVATYLLDTGADPGARGAMGMPMLCLAARSGVARLVDLLHRRGAPGTFYTAAALGDVDAARRELSARPESAKAQDENGMTALVYCAQSALGRSDERVETRLAAIAGLLMDCGAGAEAAPESYLRPLSVAAGHSGNLPLVELLLDRAANPPDEGPLYEALRTLRRQGDRYSRICDVLLRHGEYDLAPVLLGNARHEDVQATMWLLARGADPSLRVEDGRTTLHLAADRNSGIRVVGLLLDHGADIDARDDLGNTPLQYARQSEKGRIVDFLVARGAAE